MQKTKNLLKNAKKFLRWFEKTNESLWRIKSRQQSRMEHLWNELKTELFIKIVDPETEEWKWLHKIWTRRNHEHSEKYYEDLYNTKMTMEGRDKVEPSLANSEEFDEITVDELLDEE